MREILFRGKHILVGPLETEWVYGSLVTHPNNYAEIHTKDGRTLPVIQETIGQYTGLQDKNGVKIFEGDIVKWRFKRIWHEEYHIAEVIWRQSKCGWRLNTAGDTTKMREDIEYEILGNIHDNPELLEVTP